MIRRITLLGAAAIVLSAMVVLNLAILDVVTLEEVEGSLGRVVGVIAVSTAGLVGIVLLVRAAMRR